MTTENKVLRDEIISLLASILTTTGRSWEQQRLKALIGTCESMPSALDYALRLKVVFEERQ